MKLEIVSGPEAGQIVEVECPGECVIGRHARCDLRLTDPESSRCHARVTVEPGRVFVDDLESRNGTVVNGARIRHSALAEGDEIAVGTTRMRVSGVAVAEEPPKTTLCLVDPSVRVLASLTIDEADLIAGRAPPAEDSELQRENRILRSVCEISNFFAAPREPDTVLEGVLNHTKAVLEADTACIMLRDDEDTWRLRATSDGRSGPETVHVSRTIIRQAINDGKAILSDNPLDDDRFAASESIVVQKISSAVCAPMKIDDVFSGVLFVNRRNVSHPLTDLDLRFAATVANMLGVFLQNVKYQEDLIRQERLAAVGQVIAGLAHYAKNIISGLRLSIGVLQRMIRKQPVEKLEGCIESIASEERRLTDLILDMLSYAKDREPLVLEMDVREVIDGIVQLYRQPMEERLITFDLDIDPEAPATIMAEKNALHRVFLNLLGNAIDALKDAEEGHRAIRVKVMPWPEAGGIEVRFRDSGCGIPKDKLDKIFGVFFSTKGSQGTGLGLAVSRKIVEEHAGTIVVDSQEGEWTEFRVRLPHQKPLTAGAPPTSH